MNALPPGPKAPAPWQLANWVLRPLAFMEENFRKYGDVFTVNFGQVGKLVMVSSPNGVKEIFSQDSKVFRAGASNEILKPILGDYSVIFLDGEPHRRERRLLMPPFHGDSIRRSAETIVEIANQETVGREFGRPFLLRNAMQNITLNVILRTVFGVSYGDRYEQLKQLIAQMLELFSNPLGSGALFFKFMQQDFGPWGTMRQRKQEIVDLLQTEITEKRRLSERGDDVLSLLLGSTDESGEGLSDRELRDELVALLFAGHETTATALTWAFYWLAKSPEILNKLRAKLAELGPNPAPEALSRCAYLTAVCQETLRMYPVAPITFPREALKAVSILGQEYPAGTRFAPCIYLLHHRPDLYPDSKVFRPERFIERNYNASEFITFGGGNRRCIGAALAMMEMQLVIATWVLNYDFEVAIARPIKPTRRGATIAPDSSIPFTFTAQRSAKREVVAVGDRRE
ncbi:MAG: cytochrome P450 [Cyanobacteria bacterium P01_H01_bin.15]